MITDKCPYGIGFDQHGMIVPLLCKKWSCEKCRVVLARKWAAIARNHIKITEMTPYAWHLTLPGYIQTPYQGFRLLPEIWDRLRRTMQETCGDWTYLAFVECHPKRSKIPHFHTISMIQAPVLGTHIQTPIKDLAVMSGFGYIALEEEITGYKAAGYVAKYASKHDPAMPWHFQRVRASKDWQRPVREELEPFYVKSRAEHTSEFIVRVNEGTGVSPDLLYSRYKIGLNIYEIDLNSEE